MIQQRLPETEMRRAEEREYLNKEQRGEKELPALEGYREELAFGYRR